MKKLIIFLMVGMLLCFHPMKVYADAGNLVVSGGSLLVGSGAALTAGIAGPVVVAVFVGALAMGMNVKLTQASEQAGMTKTQFVKSKLEQYCNEAQITYGVFNKAITDGTTVLKDGTIKLSHQASAQIKQFINWLENTNQVQDVNAGSESENVNISGNDFLYVDSYSSNTFTMWGTAQEFIVRTYTNNSMSVPLKVGIGFVKTTNNAVYMLAISKTPFYGGYGLSKGSQSYMNASLINGYYTISFNLNGSFSQIANGMIPNPLIESNLRDIDQFINSLDGTFDLTSAGPADDTFTKDGLINTGVLNPDQDESTVINPGLTGTISVPVGQDLTSSLQDYLDALQRVLDGIRTGIIARDKVDGMPIDINIPYPTVIDPTIDTPKDVDLPDPEDQTPIYKDGDPDPVTDPNTAIQPLKFDLKNIFPFCIPFDIKDMLGKLSAEPIAPRYTVNWNIPIINQTLSFTVDLSPFNDTAAILRKMEVLLLVIGLAFVTRQLIRG